MNYTLRGILLAGLLVGSVAQDRALAQDVERLGRIHGTRPPPGYFEIKRQDPTAFQFSRGFFGLSLRGVEAPAMMGGTLSEAQVASALARAAAENPLRDEFSGTVRFPLILGLYSDTPTPPLGLTRDAIQAEFFDGPQANYSATGTIPDYYNEVSGGRISLVGRTFDWQAIGLTGAQVAGGEAGFGDASRTSEYIVRILQALDDGSVDWSQFDNDGDGYVDVLAVMHPTQGAECSGGSLDERYNRVWSHRWSLRSATAIQRSTWSDQALALQVIVEDGYATSTPAPGGGFIKVNDYTIQGVVDCSTFNPNTIGVVAHELGHGFGLPDLYNTGDTYNHSGIGTWGLMGSGSWGCDNDSPGRPCHLSAWSKSVLGWADVEVLPPGTDPATLTLPPVETTGKVYRIDAADGSGEYLLLENRQRIGFDTNLYAPGLLVWHIDPEWITARRYSVNADKNHLGVWLRQADGYNELAQNGAGRGDDGDPFPGAEANMVFHAGSNPSALTHDGEPFGATLTGIEQVGEDMSFMAYAGYRSLTLATEGSLAGTGMITVDGTPSPEDPWVFASAPFATHTIEASPGVDVAPGVRVAFQGWNDGGSRVRDYTFSMADATLTASYGGREVHLDVELSSPAQGIVPGRIDFEPGDAMGWVPEGEDVVLTAVANTGFSFLEWTGALAGQGNPAVVTAGAPLEAGAAFEVTFSVQGNPGTYQLPAASYASVQLVAENANLPVSWSRESGSLPSPLTLSTGGLLAGTPMVRGTFPLVLRATDHVGLEDVLSVTVEVVDPLLSLETLAGPFLLTGADLTVDERAYLDAEGNQNGLYDVGDFRAFWLRNPTATANTVSPEMQGEGS